MASKWEGWQDTVIRIASAGNKTDCPSLEMGNVQINRCRLKNNIHQVFRHQKGFIWEREKGCNPVHADMASYEHTLVSVPRQKGI